MKLNFPLRKIKMEANFRDVSHISGGKSNEEDQVNDKIHGCGGTCPGCGNSFRSRSTGSGSQKYHKDHQGRWEYILSGEQRTERTVPVTTVP